MKSRASYILMGICLSLMLLLTAVELVTFNQNHYKEMFDKYDVQKETGLEISELQVIMNDLLMYLKDDRPLLNTTRIENGQEIPAFGERAVLHMIDVKELFIGGKRIRNFSIIAFIGLLIYSIKKNKNWKRSLAKTLVYTAVVNVSLMVILYLLMLFDFYRYFTYFHLIFFTNDLWLLEVDELMILMLPEGFFNDTAVRIATLFLGSNIFISLLGFKEFFVVRKLKSLISRS
ncbi:TIGR01906 family membrane protein [Alkaliphilus transvaalensis]|uniref:TIGR01906 family membrane protein n=1 Tax=Alkaliphilus transvaalensis TaxID=114628 RepID=UPI00054F9BD5|nr:TIGR01906 family membrane protein [Alkaliphilus transvaalensis]